MQRRLRSLVALLLLAGWIEPGQAKDLDSMTPAEITSLQRRLTDAGCYSGAINGQASDATAQAVKTCPDQNPILRTETGMHTAPIRSIGVNAACSLLATDSYDKTVRLWSLAEGTLKQIIRLPIGLCDGGQIFAVALSPDGRWLAAGGWDAADDKGYSHGLYVTDLAAGKTRRLGSFERPIEHIVFSPDGALYATGWNGYICHYTPNQRRNSP